MNDQELMEFMYLFFGLGTVLAVYEPGIVSMLLPVVALIGAAYLVVGVFSRLTSSIFNIGNKRRNDWINAVIIFTVLILVFGQKNLVFRAVEVVLGSIFLVFSGIFSLFHL